MSSPTLTSSEDITDVWNICHSHLSPLKNSLPISGCTDFIDLVAHIRIGEDTWLENAIITYSYKNHRFYFRNANKKKSLRERSDLFTSPVTAVDARLWASSPTMINIEPTTRCNFNCWYCVGRHMKQDDIKVENFAQMLDNFPDVKTIALVGEGEPLMHKDFFIMAEMAKERGIRVLIISNGSAFSQSVIKKLCETEVAYVSISIDSADPATFAQSRIDGNLNKVLRGIKSLRDYRDSNGYLFPKIALKGTLFSHTQNELPAIVDLAKAYGVEIFESFQSLNPMESYVRIYPKDKLSNLTTSASVAKAIEADGSYGRATLQSMDDFLTEHKISFSTPQNNNPIRNNCNETWLYSLLSGDITPCCQIKTVINKQWNIFENKISEILINHEYENIRFNLWNGIFPQYCNGCWKTR